MKKVINIEARRPKKVWEVRRNASRYEFEQVSRSCNAVDMKFLHVQRGAAQAAAQG